jgi:GTP-binding protein Era
MAPEPEAPTNEIPNELPLPDELPTLRTGFVAFIGKPNVGKSTLLNALLGQKVAIVSRRPQTTRVPLRGILNRPDAQIVFIDTPGIHEPHHELGQRMVKLAQRAIPDSDVLCMLVDISKPPDHLDRLIAEQMRRAKQPRLLLLNKVDRPPRRSYVDDYRELGPWEMEIALSALKGEGMEMLVDELVARLPEGAPLYPEDWIVDQNVQTLAAEMVREKVLQFTSQEVPHAVAIEVEEWQEKEHATYIRMTINVERDSQKKILIGAGGATLKRIGRAARVDIEEMVERRVYLDLWVKTRPNWRNDSSSLGWLGYSLKNWD